MKTYKIAVLPGDGIGPEVMAVACEILGVIGTSSGNEFILEWADVGGAAIDASGKALPDATVSLCEASDAILFGSVGGPKWETLPPEKQPERGALLPLRKHFSFYANLRPVTIHPALAELSPLAASRIKNGVDMLIIRELTGDVYFAQPKGRDENRAFDTMAYTKIEVERVARFAFEAARKRKKKIHSIDKANVLTSMVFWREIVNSIAKEYPDVAVEHMYVDNAAMQLILNPSQFDLILAGNMFGDILSDEGAALTGSLGMMPSASLNEKGFGLYEPAGGSAPDIAGKDIANPIAQILSMGMMLRYSFNLNREAALLDQAVMEVINQGSRTRDIAQNAAEVVGTRQMGRLIKDQFLRLADIEG
jgi:3-isopropylmalate dehydrogenase